MFSPSSDRNTPVRGSTSIRTPSPAHETTVPTSVESLPLFSGSADDNVDKPQKGFLTRRAPTPKSASPTNTIPIAQSFSGSLEDGSMSTEKPRLSKDSTSSQQSDGKDKVSPPTLAEKMLAESVGTAMLVHFGCGSVCVALYTEALVGLGQSATIWSLGSALALYCTAFTSGGHLNPAVSLAMAVVRPTEFNWRHLIPYWIAQLLGATIAAFVNYMIFANAIMEFEEKNGITRGIDSVASAKGFGAYRTLSPNLGQAFLCEAWGTFMLTFIIFTITNKRNNVPACAVPAIVGAAIGSIIAIIGVLSGGGINPARDFGARLVSLLAGWGADSMQGVGATLVAPLVGGPIGALFADKIFRNEALYL